VNLVYTVHTTILTAVFDVNLCYPIVTKVLYKVV